MSQVQSDLETATRNTVRKYFKAIKEGGWEAFIADDIVFTAYVLGLPRQVRGKSGYVSATKRFLQVVRSVELRQLIVEGTNACAMSIYRLESPQGTVSSCEVAEILNVQGGRIGSSTIFFDTAGFNTFIAPFAAKYYREEL